MNARTAFADALIAQRVAARYLLAADYNEYVERKKREGEKPLDKKEWESRTQGGGSQGEPKGKPEPKEIRKKQYEKDLPKLDRQEKEELSEIDGLMKGLPKEDAPSVLDKALKFLGIKSDKGDSAKQKMELVRKEIQEEYADKRTKFKDQYDKDAEALEKASPEEAEAIHRKQESARTRLQEEANKPGRLKKFKKELADAAEAEKKEKARKEKAERDRVSPVGPSVGRTLRTMPRIHIAQRVAERYTAATLLR